MLQGFARLIQDYAGTQLPEVWCKEVQSTLEEVYGPKAKELGMDFAVWGEIYKNELLVIASMFDKNDQTRLPVTFFLSADLDQKVNYDDLLKMFPDALGLRFDDYFSVEDWSEFFDSWQTIDMGKCEIYSKSNRENIKLSLLADQILSASGHGRDGSPYND